MAELLWDKDAVTRDQPGDALPSYRQKK